MIPRGFATIGAIMRAVTNRSLCSASDRVMRAAIERLNEVSESIAAETANSREAAINSVSEDRL